LPERRRRIPLAVGVPPGPSSPTSPQIDSYYYLLRHGRCSELRAQIDTPQDSSGALFAAAADVCIAAQNRAPGIDWAAVRQAYLASSGTDCLTRAVRVAVRGALREHDLHPAAVASFAKKGAGLACTPVPTQVMFVQDSPSSPPMLVILGVRLFEATKVKVGAQWLTATSRNAQEGTECARVDVPGVSSVAEGDVVEIQVRGRGYVTPLVEWSIDPLVTSTEPDGSVPPNALASSPDLNSQDCIVEPAISAATP
jgi:hypothetical protein